jgi:pimeloyl-ACP methyl ester carboxylesterase
MHLAKDVFGTHFDFAGTWIRGCGALFTRIVSAGVPIRRNAPICRNCSIAQDVIDMADKLRIAQFSVVGHDWGGLIAYTLAALDIGFLLDT